MRDQSEQATDIAGRRVGNRNQHLPFLVLGKTAGQPFEIVYCGNSTPLWDLLPLS